MKSSTHPTYYPSARVICACGNTITVGSTQQELRVELCSKCHPFYTGQQKLVDTARRVDKFQKRAEAKTAAAETRRGRRLKLAARNIKRQLKVDESKRMRSKHHTEKTLTEA